MPPFQYRAMTAEGKTLTGSLEAATRAEAVSQLRRRGVRPLRVDSAGAAAKTRASAAPAGGTVRGRVGKRDVLVFTRQLGALLKAGITMSNALVILREQSENEKLAALLKTVGDDIQQGDSLSEALQKHPKAFSALYCNMIRVGETGGVLDDVLLQLAKFMDAEAALRSNVATALTYPLLVVFVGLGSIGILVTVVIPRLQSVFADFGPNLPWMTRALIGVSDFLVSNAPLLLLTAAALVGGALYLYRQPAWRERADRAKERIPALGPMLLKAQIARFTRTMGTLVKSGIPVLRALTLVAETSSSRALSNALRGVAEKVKRGEGLARPLRETGFFPPMVVNLISVGEESGSLDDMLFQVADTYDEEVQHAIKRFITLFEPLVIILMAMGVGGVLVAFLLPILNISNMVG